MPLSGSIYLLGFSCQEGSAAHGELRVIGAGWLSSALSRASWELSERGSQGIGFSWVVAHTLNLSTSGRDRWIS